ncbi:MAG: aromatic ring-hydroxylating dioxygenase subunit alpha [Pseudomonadota bacterium]|nr:aromatic ring-hydroxylating dioxygenase subunit alpha [Pseudomonadota bacterium]
MNVVDLDWYKKDSPSWDNPDLKGLDVDGARYYSKEFMEKEWAHMWPKVWLLLGREDQIPESGDYQMEEFGRESFLMIRQDNNKIKTFYNVCQHRGARLTFNDLGSTETFKCPYHGWQWRIDGELIEAQDSEDFPEGNPCGKLKLKEVKTETFAGFIWINMHEEASSLKEWLGPVWQDWESYEIHKWKRYIAQTVNVPCNWKIILDNFNESYHLPTVHAPERAVTKRRMPSGVDTSYKNTQFDLSKEGHNRMIMRAGYGSMQKDGKIEDPLYSVMKEWEINPDDFSGKGLETREAIQNAKREIGPKRGYTHYKNLRNEQLTDAFHYTLFPNFAVSLWADGFHFLRAKPHPTDPEKCVFDNWWYASNPEHETSPVRTTVGISERGKYAEHDVFDLGEKSLGQTIDQDSAVFILQQHGLRSRGFDRAYFAGQEKRIRRFHEMIESYFE